MTHDTGGIARAFYGTMPPHGAADTSPPHLMMLPKAFIITHYSPILPLSLSRGRDNSSGFVFFGRPPLLSCVRLFWGAMRGWQRKPSKTPTTFAKCKAHKQSTKRKKGSNLMAVLWRLNKGKSLSVGIMSGAREEGGSKFGRWWCSCEVTVTDRGMNRSGWCRKKWCALLHFFLLK